MNVKRGAVLAGLLLLISQTSVPDATASVYRPSWAELVAKDDNGNRVSQIETLGAIEQTTYTYDALNRLETVKYPADAAFPNGRLVTYGYDRAGNRETEITTDPTTTSVLASKTGTFDPLNRLTTLTDNLDGSKTVVYDYDDNGNQLSKTVGAGAGGVRTNFVYDVRDKLVEAKQGATTLVQYQHDFEGRLIHSDDDQGKKQYVYDQTSRLAEYSDSGQPLARYDYGSDRLIRFSHVNEGVRFYHFDALGSVTAMTDTFGTPTTRLHLDAWGIFRSSSELTTHSRYAYTGYVYSPLLELYVAGARMYDPATGRFTSQDSYLGSADNPPSLHRYMRAYANPTTYVDPTGHIAVLAGAQAWLEETRQDLIDSSQDFAEAMDRYTPRALASVGDRLKGEVSRGVGMFGGLAGVAAKSVGALNWGANAAVATFAPNSQLAREAGQETNALIEWGAAFYEGRKQEAALGLTIIREQPSLAGGLLLEGSGAAAMGAVAQGAALVRSDPRTVAGASAFTTEFAADLVIGGKGAGMTRSVVQSAARQVDNLGGSVVRTLNNATDHLPLRWSANPGSNLGNLKSKVSTPGGAARGTASGYEPLRPHPIDPNVPGGAANYRGRYNAALDAEGQSRLPADWDVHHSVPQQLRGDPRLRGIDLDAPSQMRGVPGYRQPGVETNVHSLMDQEWRQFLRSNPNATRQELLSFRDYQDWRFQHTFWESQARPKP